MRRMMGRPIEQDQGNPADVAAAAADGVTEDDLHPFAHDDDGLIGLATWLQHAAPLRRP